MPNAIEPTQDHPRPMNTKHVSSVVRLLKLTICLLGLLPVWAESGYAQTIVEVTWRPSDFVGAVVSTRTTLVYSVEVDGLPVVGAVYLGCSYLDRQGSEVDLEARRVRRMSRRENFQWRVPSDAGSIVFALWEQKITPEALGAMSREEYQEVMSSNNPDVFRERVRRLESLGYFLYGRIGSTEWLSLAGVDPRTQPLGGTLYPRGHSREP